MQTLKLQASKAPFGRNEWEWPVRADTPELDLLSGTPIAPMLRCLPALKPVFVTDVERTVRTVRWDEATIEVALDLGCIRSDRAEGHCMRKCP